MIVSGTYWPPYGPNRPWEIEDLLAGAIVIVSDGLQKSLNQTWVLAAACSLRKFDAAADIYTQRRQGGQGQRDVVGAQAAGDEAARPDGLQGGPIERHAGATGQAVGVRVEQIQVSPQRVGHHHL